MTKTFSYTGAATTFTVPASITCVQVKAIGASGGAGGYGDPGGFGASLTAVFSVSPGDTIGVDVGQNGSQGGVTHGGGGASGGAGGYAGGSGGGATVVSLNSALVLMAGGGGGSGGLSNGGSGGVAGDIGGAGGNAGSAGGNGSGELGCAGATLHGGAPGVGLTPGTAGDPQGCGGQGTAGTASSGTTPGTGGTGGGGNQYGGGESGGGGGGGGYAGGGGGAGSIYRNAGGGGGGSSYSAVTGSTNATDSTGTPKVSISYVPSQVTVNALADATYGSAYTGQITPTTGSAPSSWGLADGQSLPPGLQMAADGSITGKPTSAGNYSFNLFGYDGSGNVVSGASASLKVNRAPLKVMVRGSQTYGGTNQSIVAYDYIGLRNFDNQGVLGGSLSGCQTSVAASAAVLVYSNTITGCTGLTAGNYDISYGDGGFTVNPAPLSVLVAGSQSYGGTNKAFQVTQYQGLTANDTSAALGGALSSCTTTVPASAGIGTTQGSISGCGGLSSNNYDIHYVDVGFTVNAKLLNVTVTGSRTYGGNDTTFSAQYSGLANGDSPSAVGTLSGCTTSVPASAAAGTTQNSISGCGGLSSSNYDIHILDGGFTVNKAPLQVTVTGSQAYGGSGQAFKVSQLSGLTNGDTSSAVGGTLAGCTTSVVAASPVGVTQNSIAGCTGLSSSNYSISYVSGAFTVERAVLTATVTGTQALGGAGQSFKVSLSGFVNQENPAVVSGALSGCTTTVSAGAAAGLYNNSIANCGGLAAANYTFTYVDGGFTVLAAAGGGSSTSGGGSSTSGGGSSTSGVAGSTTTGGGFSIVRRSQRNGKITLSLSLPRGGSVSASAIHVVRHKPRPVTTTYGSAQRTFRAGGTVQLVISPSAAGAALRARVPHAKLFIVVTFRSAGQAPVTRTSSITL